MRSGRTVKLGANPLSMRLSAAALAIFDQGLRFLPPNRVPNIIQIMVLGRLYPIIWVLGPLGLHPYQGGCSCFLRSSIPMLPLDHAAKGLQVVGASVTAHRQPISFWPDNGSCAEARVACFRMQQGISSQLHNSCISAFRGRLGSVLPLSWEPGNFAPASHSKPVWPLKSLPGPAKLDATLWPARGPIVVPPLY